jgi:integrase
LKELLLREFTLVDSPRPARVNSDEASECLIRFLALLVGCALRRNELAELEIETIQWREGRWVLADLEGKGRRIQRLGKPHLK